MNSYNQECSFFPPKPFSGQVATVVGGEKSVYIKLCLTGVWLYYIFIKFCCSGSPDFEYKLFYAAICSLWPLTALKAARK